MISPQRHRIAAALLAAATVPALLAAAAPQPERAPNGVVHQVRPGESVQAAVDAARPGDVIELAAGTYPGGVTISTDRLTLRGQGDATVFDAAATPAGGTPSACTRAGHGLCVTGLPGAPVTGVTVESLAVTGFTKNGLNASRTDGLVVRDVLAHHNLQQGISEEMSVRSRLIGNEARNNGQAGIFIANSVEHEGGALDTRGTAVEANLLSGNRIGVVLRRTRALTVEDNLVTGNCGGVFVVGDEGVPRAGALTVRRNVVASNNSYCPPNPRLDFIQGTGILLTGTEDVTVADNQVVGNTGTSPMSGGIVIYKSVVGMPNARATVTGNQLSANGPADLADRDTGTGHVLAGNVCQVSEPAGRC
ncbi:right-handed parallel beta-helix repeat-containing protein [Kitasatospora camelliae]|uniref:Right-handed parallel beta-helix repeat-containing protein n=1 Tax=Kitasatospora camelliae TaxID=3156397 RepID=A0AAU8K4Y3_9ACTN